MGHSTRSIALIRKLIKNNIEIIVRNSNNITLLQKSLPGIKIIDGITDVGPIIKNDGISLDSEKSKRKIESWIENIPNTAKNELNFISKIKPSLIISDVSAMPLKAAHQNKIPSLIISNFSWYDVLNYISPNHRSLLKEFYSFSDYTIKLPLGTKMNHFQNIKTCGLVCRIPTIPKNVVRKTFELNSKLSILFTIGKNQNTISVDSEIDCKIISTGSKILYRGKIIEPIYSIEGQNLVNAVDLVICKCGYGTISECLSTGTPFCYISDDSHLEQKAISDELKIHNFGLRIPNSNKFILNSEHVNSISHFEPNDIDTVSVVNYIQSILN